MGKSDFDNISLQLMGEVTLAAGVTQTLELDFELPRGFIGKIWKIVHEHINIHEDAEGQATSKFTISSALMNDPDDITTIGFPSNRVDHDVLSDLQTMVSVPTAAAEVQIFNIKKETQPPKDIDIIFARNMRLNAIGSGTGVALVTESVARVTIYYTLEKVTDAMILELLNIL